MKKRVYIFLAALLISALAVSGVGAWLKYDVFVKLDVNTPENIVALPFVLAADPQLRSVVEMRAEALRDPPVPEETTVPTEPEETVPEETVPPTTVSETQEPTVPETTVPPTEPEPVDESWFDDVLFIGESRSQGLQSMGRLGKAEYFCVGAVSVYRLMSSEASDFGFPKQTLPGLLSYRKYGKIYIHLGINELGGIFDLESFTAQYQKVIDRIREAQPDAYIILQAILPVTSDYSKDPPITIEQINAVNAAIEELAQGEKLRFCDVTAYFSDEDGYLREDMTLDGCHLYGPGYQEWALRLMENAATLNIPD